MDRSHVTVLLTLAGASLTGGILVARLVPGPTREPLTAGLLLLSGALLVVGAVPLARVTGKRIVVALGSAVGAPFYLLALPVYTATLRTDIIWLFLAQTLLVPSLLVGLTLYILLEPTLRRRALSLQVAAVVGGWLAVGAVTLLVLLAFVQGTVTVQPTHFIVGFLEALPYWPVGLLIILGDGGFLTSPVLLLIVDAAAVLLIVWVVGNLILLSLNGESARSVQA